MQQTLKGGSGKVLRMAQKEYIKDLYENEEVSLREISRITGHSFQTVRKYAYQEDWSEEHLPNIEPEKYPVLKDFIPITENELKETWGITDINKAIRWYEKQLGMPIAEWGVDECDAVRAVLKEQQEKRKKAQEKAKQQPKKTQEKTVGET